MNSSLRSMQTDEVQTKYVPTPSGTVVVTYSAEPHRSGHSERSRSWRVAATTFVENTQAARKIRETVDQPRRVSRPAHN